MILSFRSFSFLVFLKRLFVHVCFVVLLFVRCYCVYESITLPFFYPPARVLTSITRRPNLDINCGYQTQALWVLTTGSALRTLPAHSRTSCNPSYHFIPLSLPLASVSISLTKFFAPRLHLLWEYIGDSETEPCGSFAGRCFRFLRPVARPTEQRDVARRGGARPWESVGGGRA